MTFETQAGPRPLRLGVTRPQTRLRQYRRWIRRGWALDLNDAVRLNSQLNRTAQHATREHDAYAWRHRDAAKAERRRAHQRAVVLGMTQSCTFCVADAADVTLLVPLSDGGQDVLSNKVAVCNMCRSMWPRMRRWVPQRIIHKLTAALPHRGL
ncbi:hypothetical protein [Streptomyces griseoaurantiacus]|uniref:HNH endonuclease n=1 Tax=Streptomyces griseoaurantiacus TaxID=68213 RepID=A0A7W2HUM9_9ACTN|nr:hypothetical protein [Streptomyces griseoaurantiacus]MBA5222203.1 hypothetical protein [Streptomyces griseoaurantiacus]